MSDNTIASPLEVISGLFQQAGCPTTAGKDFGVVDFFAKELSSEQVPLLDASNIDSLPNLSLVRLQGTVQDLPNPELYVGVAKLNDGSLITTKYSDGDDSRVVQSEQVALWDRQRAVLVPSPKSHWVGQHQHQLSGTGHCHASAEEVLLYMYDRQGKDLVLHDLVEVVGILSRVPSQQQAAEPDMHALSHDMETKCGVCEEPSCGGCAKEVPVAEFEDDQDVFAEAKAFGKMVRVHAILIKRQPLLVEPAQQLQQQAVLPLRQQALQLLSSCLGGDTLAAEYLLMLSLQRVTSRASELPMGVAPLNICNCPAPSASPKDHEQQQDQQQQQEGSSSSPFGASLHLMLASLLPLTSCLPLSIPACNSGGWVPKRAPGEPRVSRSPLQLPPGSVLLVDETILQEGMLDESGTVAVRTLGRVLQEQVLLYEFEMYQHPVPVNVPAVVLSTGRSILRDVLPVQVPLTATKDMPSLEAVRARLSEPEVASQLAPIRSYLAAAAQLPYELTDGARQQLVDEFVKTRQRDPAFGAEQFQTQLTLARACALSFGEAELSSVRWEHLKELEGRRQARLRVV